MDNKIEAGTTKYVVAAKNTDATDEPVTLRVEEVDASFRLMPGVPQPLSKQERAQRKKKRKAVKASKRRNR